MSDKRYPRTTEVYLQSKASPRPTLNRFYFVVVQRLRHFFSRKFVFPVGPRCFVILVQFRNKVFRGE